MKTSLLVKATGLAFCGILLVAANAKADPNRNNRHSEKMLINESEERYVYVTGSHMRQKVKLRSIGTDTPYNLRIYTQRELLSTGRQTPGEALTVLDPSITITGRH
jgi:hypothetical protein